MKKLPLSILATAALALFALKASAQSYDGPLTLSYTGIGTTAGGATTTVTNQIIDVTKVKSLPVMAKFNFSDTTTSNVVFTFSRSLDMVNWETTPTLTWTVAGSGTTAVIAATTLDVSGFGWVKLNSIQNTHASLVLTNSWFQYGIKKNAP